MSMNINVNYGGITKSYSHFEDIDTINTVLTDDNVTDEFAFNISDVKVILNGQERSLQYGLRDGDTLYVEQSSPMRKA